MALRGRDEVRAAADQIEATEGRGRFRRRRAGAHDERSAPLVLAAIARAKTGDPDAIRFLYLRYADNVYGYVCSIVRDEHEAEDVTQLVFAKLLTALPKYEPRLVPFSAWILRVAHNAAIDHVRARRSIPVAEVRSADTADADLGSERAHDLRAALQALPPDQRDVVILRFILGLTPGEIAQHMNRSEDAIHGLQHRGRRTLRTELTRTQAAPTTLRAAA
jgi:RNA polymerase sigma-70 factor (ECF subfamily)